MKTFLIDHIDPLGQGVYKENDEVYFIPKTLPAETGSFIVNKRTKGVNFCTLKELKIPSPKRINPSCIHFNECSGCHFLHTDYKSEIEFKLSGLKKLLSRLNIFENEVIKVLESDKRTGYRNRIQLHYNLRDNSLGFKQARSKKIINIPECMIMTPLVQGAYNKLKTTWKAEAKQRKSDYGHIEIYEKMDSAGHQTNVNISWNKTYAQGGFSQVNSNVNQKIQNIISSLLPPNLLLDLSILDLFGGAGNFSNLLNSKEKLSIDIYPDEKRNNRFFHLDLFTKDALKDFLELENRKFDFLIIDPPRSGFKNLYEWSTYFRPKYILYVSCHSATMLRDLNLLQENYQIESIYLADLFPSTFHYEGIIFLKNKSTKPFK